MGLYKLATDKLATDKLATDKLATDELATDKLATGVTPRSDLPMQHFRSDLPE